MAAATRDTTPSETTVDRWLLGGALLLGLSLTCVIGMAMILYGLYLEARARTAGVITRPAVITAIALYGMSNGLIELFSAHGMLWASDNPIFKPLVEVYGIYIDERYWGYGYNTAGQWWGGPADRYETTWNITTGFFVFPIYTVAHYGLYRMERWGHYWSLISTWLFTICNIHYSINHAISGFENALTAEYPVWGWALVNYPYILTPFIAVFILHAANTTWFTGNTGRRP